MRDEHRVERRVPLNLQGALGAGGHVHLCRVEDVSASGARLRLREEHSLPQEFTLSLTRNGSVRRRCRLLWREKDLVGVKFTATEDEQDAA